MLPHVENATVTLLGATTENPSFEVNAALLSRSRVIRLEDVGVGDVPGEQGARFGGDLRRGPPQGLRLYRPAGRLVGVADPVFQVTVHWSSPRRRASVARARELAAAHGGDPPAQKVMVVA